MANNTPNQSSGNGKLIVPLIVLAAVIATGWLWTQSSANKAAETTASTAAEYNGIAPAAGTEETTPAEATPAENTTEEDTSNKMMEATQAPSADSTAATPMTPAPVTEPATTMEEGTSTPQADEDATSDENMSAKSDDYVGTTNENDVDADGDDR